MLKNFAQLLDSSQKGPPQRREEPGQTSQVVCGGRFKLRGLVCIKFCKPIYSPS